MSVHTLTYTHAHACMHAVMGSTYATVVCAVAYRTVGGGVIVIHGDNFGHIDSVLSGSVSFGGAESLAGDRRG